MLPSLSPSPQLLPVVPLSTTLWWCNTPASIPIDLISQVSGSWMEKGPAGSCPAHNKGQDWQVSLRDHTVITQLRYDTFFVCLSFFRTLFLVMALHNKFQLIWSTLDLLYLQGQFECCSGSPWIPNQMANILTNEISKRKSRKWGGKGMLREMIELNCHTSG